MTTKERILERLEEARKYHMDAAGRISPYGYESASRDRHIELAEAFRRAIGLAEAEFAKEGEESTPIYIIEFRAKGGKWQIFDMDGDRGRERAESYIPSNQVAYPDCEFRVVAYRREGEK